MMARERALVWYLRAYGVLLLLALPALVVPSSWLAWAYEALGLGTWSELPLVEYLARSASAVYALVGALVLWMSFDPPRYRPLLLLLGWVSLPAGVYLLVLDVALGFPWWWVLLEGPGVLLSGVVLIVLARPGSVPRMPGSA
jgi:hypothetical protein